MAANLIGKKILVTGGAGFIGSHLVEDLLQAGSEICVLDNFVSGKRSNLENLANGKFSVNRDFKLIEGDIRNLETVLEASKGVDFILHQAALGSVPRSVNDPITTHCVNADGSLNIFWAAQKNGVKRVVYASSSSVYGSSEILPKKEGEEGAPLSPYALSKKINEDYSKLFHSLYGLQSIGLRYFNVYGPRQDPDSEYAAVIPRFCKALLSGKEPIVYGTGKQSRDFTFVKDVVKANIAAMNAPEEATGKAFNIGRGSSSTLLELLDELCELLQSSVKPKFDPPRKGDVLHSTADIGLAERTLQFKATKNLRDGLSESIEWYKNNL